MADQLLRASARSAPRLRLGRGRPAPAGAGRAAAGAVAQPARNRVEARDEAAHGCQRCAASDRRLPRQWLPRNDDCLNVRAARRALSRLSPETSNARPPPRRARHRQCDRRRHRRRDDDFLSAEGMAKGAMRLIDAEEAERLYAAHGPGARGRAAGRRPTPRRASPRSAAAPASSASSRTTSSAQFYRHDIRSLGVEFTTPPRDVGAPTARCLILVTPDGAADDEHLPRRRAASADERARRGADRASRRSSTSKAICGTRRRRATRCTRRSKPRAQAGRKVAFTLSDTFCVDRHRDGFNALLDERRIDILFANQAEIEALRRRAASRQRGRRA